METTATDVRLRDGVDADGTANERGLELGIARRPRSGYQQDFHTWTLGATFW